MDLRELEGWGLRAVCSERSEDSIDKIWTMKSD